MTWAQGVHSSSHRPSRLRMWPYNNGLRGHKNLHTHTQANITLNTHTHSDEWMPLRFDINSLLQRCRKFRWDCACVCECVCIIKPSSNIYWGQMGGRMLPVSARGNEGSGEMMKRWGCATAVRGHFTYNGNPESLSVFLSWSPLMATEDQRGDAGCFQNSFRWSGRSVWYFCWVEVKLGL